MKKKVNPRRKPVNEAQAKKMADDSFWRAIAIMMSTVAETDKFNEDEITILWDKINDKSDSIAKGYVSLKDICVALYEEYGISVGGGRYQQL